ncbi:MAG: hypothetical protein QXK07_01110 [Desulfurococcaceae archaeon]
MGRLGKILVALFLIVLVVLALRSIPWRTPAPPPTPTLTPWRTPTPSPTPVQEEKGPRILESLGVLEPADPLIREIWAQLAEYRVDDPRIKPYMDWLTWAMTEPSWAESYPFRDDSTGPYIVINAGPGLWRYYTYPPEIEDVKPASNTSVRVGYVKLAYGMGAVITAYQSESGRVNVVVHGTILNETELYRFYLKATGLTGLLDLNSDLNPITAIGYLYAKSPESRFTSPTGEPLCESTLKESCEYVENLKVSVQWVLWRISVDGPCFIEETTPPGQEPPPPWWQPRYLFCRVHVLLEAPVVVGIVPLPWALDYYDIRPEHPGRIGVPDGHALVVMPPYGFETFYWQVAHPVFAIATRISNSNLLNVANRGIFMGVDYRGGGDITPLNVRLWGGGVCKTWSSLSALMATTLGYPTVYLSVPYHAISTLVMLSSLGEHGELDLGEVSDRPAGIQFCRSIKDIDMDGAPDSLTVFVNINDYDYPVDAIRNFMRNGHSCMRYLCLPGLCYMPKTWPLEGLKVESTITLMLIPALLGIPEYLLGLPEWLKTPAFTRYQFLTERYLYDFVAKIPEDEELFNRFLGVVYYQYMWTYMFYELDEETGEVRISFTGAVPDPLEPFIHALRKGERYTEFTLRFFNITLADFAPPSATTVRTVLNHLVLLYENTETPTATWLLEKIDNYAQSKLGYGIHG